MNNILNSHLEKFNSSLIEFLPYQDQLGLSKGKIGLCCYFFSLYKEYESERYLEEAQKLMNETMCKIDQIEDISLLDGLIGVILSINYLHQNNFIEGDIELLFKKVDDNIYRKIYNPIFYNSLEISNKIDILYYLYIRTYNSECRSYYDIVILEEQVMYILNDIYNIIDLSFFEEEIPININYKLPFFLYVISKLYSSNICRNKILMIINELYFKLLSIIPYFHANRLFYLFGLFSIKENIGISSFDEHIKLLHDNINLDKIINHEFESRKISVFNGLLSIYLILFSLKNYFSKKEIILYQKKIFKRIESSCIWEIFNGSRITLPDKEYGLLTGLSGVFILIIREHKKRS